MDKPPVLIDCDGVLADFDSAMFEYIESKYDIYVRDTTEWDIMEDPRLSHIKEELWNWIFNTNGVIRSLKKYDYANEMLQELREFSHVICATSSVYPNQFPKERTQWLIEELNFDRKDICLFYKKHLINGIALVDDKPSNVESWADKHHKNGGIPVLWQTPNRGHKSEDDRILHTGDPAVLIETIKDCLNG